MSNTFLVISATLLAASDILYLATSQLMSAKVLLAFANARHVIEILFLVSIIMYVRKGRN
jgi:hypothetical protein